MTTLIVVAVEKEAEAIARCGARVVVAGIGRTNAAAETTRAILQDGPFDCVISAGIAGALPGSGLVHGDLVLASECVYVEEGLMTPEGFRDMRGLGFPLGDFEGNRVPVDSARAASAARALGIRLGPIATVATCSGSDAAAAEVVRRTGAVAEAMEGAAVVHAGRRLRIPGLELRAISNTTGNRTSQQWNIAAALDALRVGVDRVLAALDEDARPHADKDAAKDFAKDAAKHSSSQAHGK